MKREVYRQGSERSVNALQCLQKIQDALDAHGYDLAGDWDGELVLVEKGAFGHYCASVRLSTAEVVLEER